MPRALCSATVQLPKTACLNPSPSFYSQFNGAWLAQQPRALLRGRHAVRLTPLPRALLVLYIAYPGARAHRAGRLLRASASRLCSPVPAEWLQV